MLKGLRNIARMLSRVVRQANEDDGWLTERARDRAAFLAERAAMTGGRGFRSFPKPVRKFSDGTTRGDRKRAAREMANAKVSEFRPAKYRNQRSMHLA